MREREDVRLLTLVGVALTLTTMLACGAGHGREERPPTSKASPSSPGSQEGRGSPPPGASTTLVFVVRPGADPTAVGRRIAGPDAVVTHGPQGYQENVPRTIAVRTYQVQVGPGEEQAALGRARADRDVQLAYLQEPGLPPPSAAPGGG